VSGLCDLVGRELGPTSWMEITQERIDAFSAATDDPQWIHVDPARAAAGPFGTTIAHGFLTLSLCVAMLREALPAGGGMTLNYGTNRVRFPTPVPSGSRIRGRFRVLSVDAVDLGWRATIRATVEVEDADKPACVAELIVLTVS
jgi:acyl dehydratase